MWTWLGLMNAHRLCWGFAVTQPFAQIVALATLASMLINKQTGHRFPWFPLSKTLAVWWFWMFVTTIFALNQNGAWEQWDKVWKIQLFVFVTIYMLTSKERINALVWTMLISLGFYGVKGGIFTLQTGGNYAVWGPPGSFIGGNNEIGLALIMTIPLMRYIQLTAQARWMRRGMTVSMGLCFASILGTHSRGALLGLAVMLGYLVWKSRRKGALLIALVLLLPVAYMFMPESWHERMSTIQDYEQDKSAMGRINAWQTAWNVAVDRPLVGGGFEMFRPWIFSEYSPDPSNFHDVHSIYFEALGEHGFVGLFWFLFLGYLGLRTARKIVRETSNDPRLFWMRDLASMVHVSLIGYAAAGAFLGLAYFDFYYTLLAVLVGVQSLLAKYRVGEISEAEAGQLPSGPPGGRNFGRSATAGRTLGPRRQVGLVEVFKAWFSKL